MEVPGAETDATEVAIGSEDLGETTCFRLLELSDFPEALRFAEERAEAEVDADESESNTSHATTKSLPSGALIVNGETLGMKQKMP